MLLTISDLSGCTVILCIPNLCLPKGGSLSLLYNCFPSRTGLTQIFQVRGLLCAHVSFLVIFAVFHQKRHMSTEQTTWIQKILRPFSETAAQAKKLLFSAKDFAEKTIKICYFGLCDILKIAWLSFIHTFLRLDLEKAGDTDKAYTRAIFEE